MFKLKKKLFYSVRKFGYQIFRDLTKLILLVSSGIFLKKRKELIPELINKKRHLVILRPDGIGDFVVFFREFHRYRILYPSADWEITLVGNNVWQALAEDWNASFREKWFDEFLSIDRKQLWKSFKYRKNIALSLKLLKCDELIYPVHSRDVLGIVFSHWIRAKEKIAPLGDSACLFFPFKYLSDKIFTKLILESKTNLLEVDRADFFIRMLGDKTLKSSCLLSLPVTQKMQEEKEKVLSAIGLKADNPYLIIFPGASWAGKRWPVVRFVEFGREKKEEHFGLSILVCGGGDEIQLGQAVAEGIGKDAYNVAGKTTLIGLAGLAAGAIECVGNDTAVVHLSAAFKVPTICVLGGGHWGRFWPYGDIDLNRTVSHSMPCFGCGWACIYKRIPVPCIEQAYNNITT